MSNLNFSAFPLESILDLLIPRTAVPRSEFPIDILNEDNVLHIYASLAGANKNDIDVDICNNKLTISAVKHRPYGTPETSELLYGNFKRVITLPLCVSNRDSIAVTFVNGILCIKINKLVEDANKISVKVGDGM